MADANSDGFISYAEFAPMGADIIQTMRMRRLHATATAYNSNVAEAQARETLHGMGEEQMTAFLLDAFRTFDADGNGTLDPSEMKACLEQLDLSASQGREPVHFSTREVGIVMQFMDDNDSGTIEYNEFAPLMFNWMVEAIKLGFMQTQVTELEAYLQQHVAAYDTNGTGKIGRANIKKALFEADLLKPPLTPVQIFALLADAEFDEEDMLLYVKFLTVAAPLVQGMCDPLLEHKRDQVQKRAQISTPLQALTEEEKRHFLMMVERIFTGYDKDGSGKLEFAEFRQCLKESQLGLSDKQISYLMSVSDTDEDGTIDYHEFVVLFFEALVELARMEAIEREVKAEAVANFASLMLDPSWYAIPLHIIFDLACDGAEDVEGAKFADALAEKAEREWGFPPDGIAPILDELRATEKLSYNTFVELLVGFTGAPPAPSTAAAPAEEAPTGEE